LRRLLSKIDEGIAAVGQVNGHEAAAAQVAAARMCHRERVAHGYRRVHGVAALTQNRGAHIRGEVLRAHHHSRARFDFQRGGGVRRQAGHEQYGAGKSTQHKR